MGVRGGVPSRKSLGGDSGMNTAFILLIHQCTEQNFLEISVMGLKDE